MMAVCTDAHAACGGTHGYSRPGTGGVSGLRVEWMEVVVIVCNGGGRDERMASRRGVHRGKRVR